LLYQAETSDPVNTTTTLGFHHDEVEFADELREHVHKHALKTREQWKESLLGMDEDDEDDEDEDNDEDDENEESDEDGEDWEEIADEALGMMVRGLLRADGKAIPIAASRP
jgi:hypothetical protein